MNVWHGHYRTRRNGIGFTDSIHTQEVRNYSSSPLLTQVERREYPRLVSSSMYGRVYRLTWGSKILLTLQAIAGLRKIEVSEEDLDKNAFMCHCGLFRFTGMGSGLKNGSRTVQRVREVLVTKVK